MKHAATKEIGLYIQTLHIAGSDQVIINPGGDESLPNETMTPPKTHENMNKPTFNYNEVSDTLYISFEPGQPATGIELNDHILLRIDKDKRQAVGITFFEYSILAQTADFGPRSFPLPGLAQLSADLRGLVLEILLTSPVKEILTLSTYTPSYAEAIPITSVHNLPMAG